MRKLSRWAPRIGVALASVALIGADDSSCSSETKDEPDKRSASGGDKGDKKTEKKKAAKVGDSITLEGADTKMQVTVLGVTDPIPAGEFDQPESGNRFVGIEVRLRNVGEKTYDDSPSNGAELLMSDDTQAKGGFVSQGSCTTDFGSSAKIAPGSTQKGCLPYEAPTKLKPKTFQFSLDSGFGPQNGEWKLR